jgi:ABC-2 type transport system ATP-binding protein
MDEAEALCDRIAIIDRGRLLALGSSQELIQEGSRRSEDCTTLEDAFLAITGRPLP